MTPKAGGRMTPREFDTWMTPETVCPYCGYKNRDSWELDGDDGNTWCGECDEEFFYSRIVNVEYCTEKLEGK